jgi:8-oxo-dGTP diphosphatase
VASLLARLWGLLGGALRWRILWLAHAKFIVGVGGVTLDDSGRVLLLRHRFWSAGAWGLPGGYANAGERLEDALAREVREETGYAIRVGALVRVVSGYRLRVEATYAARLVGGTLALDGREILEARFFPVDRLPEGLLASHRDLIRLALAQQAPD